jgi:hypothetical protein
MTPRSYIQVPEAEPLSRKKKKQYKGALLVQNGDMMLISEIQLSTGLVWCHVKQFDLS